MLKSRQKTNFKLRNILYIVLSSPHYVTPICLVVDLYLCAVKTFELEK